MWTMEGPPGAETVLNGRRYLYFAGTGYLGLQGHPAVISAAQLAAGQYGVHSATTRTGYGTCPPVREVEHRVARLLGSEAALYLVSGYAVNFAIAAALSSVADLLLIDEFAHDCLREATRWFDQLKRPALTFRHRDVGQLAELLHAHTRAGCRPLVLTDGVFPVSGQVAPLKEYLSALSNFDGAMLLVDDAHGLATVGETGRGSLELAGVAADRINLDPDELHPLGPRVFHTATLSKAVGGHGGVIAGSQKFLDRIRRSSGWFRGASAPAAPVAAATAKGLELVETQPNLRRQLAANVERVRGGLRALGLPVEPGPAPIIGFALQSVEQMQRVQQQLAEQGIAIAYARDYAGSGPDGMLRIAVFSTHTPEMIERLLKVLARAI